MSANCRCQSPPFLYTDYTTIDLGEDSHGAEVSLSTCTRCGLIWLKYLIEEPHYSKSGRWWRVIVSPEQQSSIVADGARSFIEQQKEGFAGGSFFDSTGDRIYAPIKIR